MIEFKNYSVEIYFYCLLGRFSKESSDKICDSSNFADDRAPLYDMYRSANYKTLIGITPKN